MDDKRISELRALCGQGMVSAVGEYTPDELWEALDELDLLRAENANLRREVEGWWEEAHDEVCTNMKDCTSYGGEKHCYRPRPEILKMPND